VTNIAAKPSPTVNTSGLNIEISVFMNPYETFAGLSDNLI
jgi:hypothetical protein